MARLPRLLALADLAVLEGLPRFVEEVVVLRVGRALAEQEEERERAQTVEQKTMSLTTAGTLPPLSSTMTNISPA